MPYAGSATQTLWQVMAETPACSSWRERSEGLEVTGYDGLQRTEIQLGI